MHATSIMANLAVPDIAAARSFYTDFLGLSTEEFDLGCVARYTSPAGRGVCGGSSCGRRTGTC